MRYWHSVFRYPSKHETLTRCWVNVEPALKTMGQHLPNTVSTSRVCWDSAPQSQNAVYVSFTSEQILYFDLVMLIEQYLP